MACFQSFPALYLEYLREYAPYQFDFVVHEPTKDILVNAYQAVSLCRLWKYMQKDTESYMFSSDPEAQTIYRKMEELGYTGHSGFSFGYAMRQMQYIAQHGMHCFKKDYLQSVQEELMKKEH